MTYKTLYPVPDPKLKTLYLSVIVCIYYRALRCPTAKLIKKYQDQSHEHSLLPQSRQLFYNLIQKQLVIVSCQL